MPVKTLLTVMVVALLGSLGAVTASSAADQLPPVQLSADPAPAAPLAAPAGMAEDERSAIGAVNGFWQRHFSEYFGKPYRAPRVIGGFTGDRGPSCAGSPAQPMNAYYCPAGDFLAWDDGLMALGYRKVGDAWVYMIVAHEWGHAIQARLSRRLVSVADELQADCLAGAALTGAQRDGLITLEPGDSQEIAETLTAAADQTPWTSRSDHGDAQQRISAYNQGARGGVRACV
jgi:predicted metalloprotease